MSEAITLTRANVAALGIGIDVEDGGDTCIQIARIRAGVTLVSHLHEHPHQAVLVSGRVRLIDGGVPRVLEGFNLVTIGANRKHSVEAITDAIWLCVWAIGKADRAALDALVKG